MNSFTEIQTELEGLSLPPLALEQALVNLPLLLQPHDLLPHLNNEQVLIVDVRAPETCVDGHIPAAVSLPYQDLLRVNGSAKGLLPTKERLSKLLSGIGLTPATHVIAYDDDSGTAASRLLWTLDVVGHRSFSLLNGGFAAWDEADLPITEQLSLPSSSSFEVESIGNQHVEFDDVLLSIDNPNVVILDTRTAAEFAGEDIRAQRGGHIPSAINLDWITSTNPQENFKIHEDAELRSMFLNKGVTPDKEVIVYCQTHHRSSHTYMMLKHLGYPCVRAYAGSWSEWGNRSDALIEV